MDTLPTAYGGVAFSDAFRAPVKALDVNLTIILGAVCLVFLLACVALIWRENKWEAILLFSFLACGICWVLLRA